MWQAGKRVLRCVIGAALVCAAFVAAFPTVVRADEAAVNAAGESVYRISWRYKDKTYSRGCCFSVGDDYVVTSWRCCMFSDAELTEEGYSSADEEAIVDDFYFTVEVSSDDETPAQLVDFDTRANWAILRLEKAPDIAKPLTVRDSRTLSEGEDVWCIGWPSTGSLRTYSKRTQNLAVAHGTVTALESQQTVDLEGGWHFEGKFLSASCRILDGQFGGPVVDANGDVVGISCRSDGLKSNVVASSGVIEGLKAKSGVSVIGVGSSEASDALVKQLKEAIEVAEEYADDADKYTDASYEKLTDAIDAAKGLSSVTFDDTMDETERNEKAKEIVKARSDLHDAIEGLEDKPTESDTGMNGSTLAAIIGGSTAALVAIVCLTVFLVRRSKAKKATAAAAAMAAQQAAAQAQAQAAAAAQAQQQAAAKPVAKTATGNASLTNVATENVNGGTLTRLSTKEEIRINRSEFTLGRDSRSVDYCLTGNSKIGRVHARFVVRGDRVFLVDNSSINGTFVNNTKLRPGVEQELRSGDAIRFADDQFKFTK